MSAISDPQIGGTAAKPTPRARPAQPVPALALPVKLYLIAVVLPVAFHAGPLYLTVLRLVLLVMIVPLTLRLLSGGMGRIILPDYLFFGHIAWMGLSILMNNPERLVQVVGSTAVEFLGGYLMARAYIRDREGFAALARWLAVTALMLLPIAIYETLTGRPPVIEFVERLPFFLSEAVVDIEARMGLERVQAVFAHPIHFGLYSSIAFAMCFVALKDRLSAPARYAMAAGLGINVFVSLSSGALLAVLIQLGLVAWASVFAGVRARWTILVVLLAILYVIVDILSDRTPIRVFMSYATFSAHNAFWRAIIFEWGMINLRGSPIFGIGLRDWIRPHFIVSPSMDNFWLVIAMRNGYPGFALLAFPYLWGLWKVGRRDFDADPALFQLRRGWMFCFIGLTFTLATVAVWNAIFSFVFFMFGAGMWMLAAEPRGSGGNGDPPPGEEEEETPAQPASRYTRFAPVPARSAST